MITSFRQKGGKSQLWGSMSVTRTCMTNVHLCCGFHKEVSEVNRRLLLAPETSCQFRMEAVICVFLSSLDFFTLPSHPFRKENTTEHFQQKHSSVRTQIQEGKQYTSHILRPHITKINFAVTNLCPSWYKLLLLTRLLNTSVNLVLKGNSLSEVLFKLG